MWNTWSCKYKRLLFFFFFFKFKSKSNKDDFFSPTSHLIQSHLFLLCCAAAGPFIITYLHSSYGRAWNHTFLLYISPVQCIVVFLWQRCKLSIFIFMSHLFMHKTICWRRRRRRRTTWLRFKHIALFFIFFPLSAGKKCVCEAVAHCYVGLEIALTTKAVPNYCF